LKAGKNHTNTTYFSRDEIYDRNWWLNIIYVWWLFQEAAAIYQINLFNTHQHNDITIRGYFQGKK
jgi:hypothetical protein